jgi:hypothetical protein
LLKPKPGLKLNTEAQPGLKLNIQTQTLTRTQTQY